MLVAIVLPFLVVSSMAQIPGTGPCKETLKSMSNFDQTKVLGKWYEYERYPTFEPNGRCKEVDLTENPDGTLQAVIKQLLTASNETHVEKLTARMSNNDKIITIVAPKDSPAYHKNILILGTDYDSYIVKGTCMNVGPSSLSYFWVMTRSQQPGEKVLANVNQVLKDEEIPEEYFIKTDQKDCPSDV